MSDAGNLYESDATFDGYNSLIINVRRPRARAGFRKGSIARAYPDFDAGYTSNVNFRRASLNPDVHVASETNGTVYRRHRVSVPALKADEEQRNAWILDDTNAQTLLTNATPTAALLKYEVKKFGGLIAKLSDTSDSTNEEESKPHRKISLDNESQFSELTMFGVCMKCGSFQARIRELEEQVSVEIEKGKVIADKHEDEMKLVEEEKDSLSKELKKVQRELKKVEKSAEAEELSNKRLTIKLEDANFEIQRLRQELITSQLENERLVEENEDMAVDNEDLLKERDEIISIYDELSRECERLKLEIGIWKGVFENNKANFPDIHDVSDGKKPVVEEDNETDGEDEGIEVEMEEDQSLLLPHRNDVQVKSSDLSGSFEVQDEIGRGKFGKVYKAVARRTGDVYVAKYIKVTEKLRKDVLETIELMKTLHHVRIANIVDVYDLGSQIVQILEYAGGGSLFERIVEKGSHTEADCVLYVKQILQALFHLHSRNVCHLDLKPENIVCVSRRSMDIKLIDFGLAKKLQSKKEIKITAGTPEFVAPEILSFDPVSLASDMWSVGVITYVLLSGVSPFYGDDDNETLMNVSCGEYEYEESLFEDLSLDSRSFIDGCLISDAKKRMSVRSCMNHSWMKGPLSGKQAKIDLSRMKDFLEKRKEKRSVNSVRAIRRFSSFGVGSMRPGNHPNLRAQSPSRQLTVPYTLQTATILEDEEESLDEQVADVNKTLRRGPMFTLTRDSSLDSKKSNDPTSGKSSRASSMENLVHVSEDTSTPDGLRRYLERMISEGNLPGTRGSGSGQITESDGE